MRAVRAVPSSGERPRVSTVSANKINPVANTGQAEGFFDFGGHIDRERTMPLSNSEESSQNRSQTQPRIEKLKHTVEFIAAVGTALELVEKLIGLLPF